MKIDLLGIHHKLCELLPVGYEVGFHFSLEYGDLEMTFTYPHTKDLKYKVSVSELLAQRFHEDYFESVVNNIVLRGGEK